MRSCKDYLAWEAGSKHLGEYEMDRKFDSIGKISVLLAIFCVLACYWIKAFYWGEYTISNNDGVIARLVGDLAKGHNPFSVESLYNSSDIDCFLAGGFFLNAIFAVPLVKFFGIAATAALYYVNGVLVMLNMVLFYFAVKKLTGNSLYSMFGAFLFLFCMQRITTFISRSDVLAETCILIVLLIGMDINREKKRYLYHIELLASAALTVLIFWLKIHYCMIGGALWIFLYINDRKKAGWYFFYLTVSFLAVSMVIYESFPVWMQSWIKFLADYSIGKDSYFAGNIGFIFYSVKQMFVIFSLFCPVFLLGG